MRSSARRARSTLPILLCFGLSVFAQAASVFAQSPAKQPAKPVGGSVTGRITIKDKPAGGILVVLRKGEASNPYEPVTKAITDPDGIYRITSIPPGSYAVVPTAPAYVPAESPAAGRKSVVIAEDENVEGINFSLIRGGV